MYADGSDKRQVTFGLIAIPCAWRVVHTNPTSHPRSLYITIESHHIAALTSAGRSSSPLY